MVAPDLVGVHVELDHLLREPGAREREAAADDEDHVRGLEVEPERAPRPEGGAEREVVAVAHGALALGLAHVMIRDNLYDHAFVDQYTHGFKEYSEMVQDYPPERVARITDVPVETIEELARLYARTKPAALMVGNGVEQLTNSIQTMRTIQILPAITGNLGIKGGYVFTPNVAWSDMPLKEKYFSELFKKSVSKHALFSGFSMVYPDLLDAISTDEPYPVRAVICQGAPLTVLPEGDRYREIIKSKLDLFVVHDLYMTTEAEIADMVLPATSFLECSRLRSTRFKADPYTQHIAVQNQVVDRVGAPQGLGIVEEFQYARTHADRPMRVAVPGPMTLLMPLRRGGPYATEDSLIADLIALVNRELRALVAAGCGFVQLDEPNYVMAAGKHRVLKGAPGPMVEALNATLEGVNAKVALHVCFGNAHNNSFATPRHYRPLYPRILDAHVDQFVFEYANREMSEIELWSEFPSDKEVAVGVVDVKAFRVETAEEVAARARLALKHIPPERLWLVPDCGLWETPRWVGVSKLRSMVEAAHMLRRELGLS